MATTATTERAAGWGVEATATTAAKATAPADTTPLGDQRAETTADADAISAEADSGSEPTSEERPQHNVKRTTIEISRSLLERAIDKHPRVDMFLKIIYHFKACEGRSREDDDLEKSMQSR